MSRSKLISKMTVILSLVWFTVGEFPQLVFGSPTQVGRFAIYGQTARPEQMRSVLDQSEGLIEKHHGALPNSIVVIVTSTWLYSAINPFARNSFAATRRIGDVVWIREGSFAENSSRSGHIAHNTRSLSSVIAHESIHVALHADLGTIKLWRIPSWLEEGYCEYVANETSYPFQAGVTRVLANHPTSDASFRYFQYYAAVRYLIETEKKSLVEIIERAEDYNYQDLAMRFASSASVGIS